LHAPSSDAAPNPFILKILQWIDARPRSAALLLGLVCAFPLYLTVMFFSDVRAGLTELLPHDAPSVTALEKLHDRLGAQSRLVVIVQSDDGDANRKFVLELGAALKARNLSEARLVQLGCHEECKWVREHALLLLPADRFAEVIEQAEGAVKHAKLEANPLFVDLEDEDAAKPQPSWNELEAKLNAEITKNDRFPTGFYELPGGKRVIMMILLGGSETELEPSLNLLKHVQEEADKLRPKYPPKMVVAYNAEVANLVEEHDAILSDISLSSALVFLLVGGVILFYFRSIRGLVAVLFALTPGLIFTFAIGRLTVHHLNSNTAFLGSIIAGNGINYPLLFLAYYRSRARTETRPVAIYHAGRQAMFGTLAAALSASAAYGALSVSTFRGFSQFGWIGGMGMITTWIFTFVAMPVAICLFDPPRVEFVTNAQRWLANYFKHPMMPRLAALAFVVLSLIGGALGVQYALKNGLYEMDLQGLRNRESLKSGSASWDPAVGEVFGIWLNPVAALVDDPVEREQLAADLRKTLVDGPDHVAERVETIQEFVPPIAQQEERVERLKKFKESLKNVPTDKIPEKIKPYLDGWLSESSLKPITLAEVPASLKAPFTEVSGDSSRVLLLFPSLKINYNDGRNVLRFADQLHSVPMPKGAVVGGGFLFMAEIIRLVHDEAPKVILTVALLVALVLTPLLIRKPWRILLVVGTVGTVALLAQANMLAFGIQLNMLDFAAVPITIGVGADYVVNLIGAMDALKLDARRACVKMGGAIFLCSLTTVIGYASLLVAQSGALRTFGWAAVVGEVLAAAAVLVVLPVLLAPAEEKAPEPAPAPTSAA
jgi:predicted RND superfamily exporter protein